MCLLLFSCLVLVSCQNPELQSKEWKIPDHMPAGIAGEQVQYGQKLIADTPLYLGPESKLPYAGNHLRCQNCHLQAGTQANALGFVGITARFPQDRARENRKISLEERINGCFDRSLNGRSLPTASREMRAMVAYMHWLSQDFATGQSVQGQGMPKIALLDRAANPQRGKAVYQKHCQVCHQVNGQGQWHNPQNPAAGYRFPPLWGSDSFNTGAGMHRLITAAQYIKANMPLGKANLSVEDSFDVAAYINSQDRPKKSGLEDDFPDRSRKPVDAPFPPWPDQFSAEQHRYGPFKPMMEVERN